MKDNTARRRGASGLERFHAAAFARQTGLDTPPPPGQRRRNLLLIARRKQHGYLEELCQEIAGLAPDITPFVLRDGRKSYYHRNRLRCLFRPTLAVSFCRPREFQPAVKAFSHGWPMRKSEEYEALQCAGIPVPRWALLREGQSIEVDGFGEYVVMKPDRGTKGADVTIRRTSRLRWKAPETDQAVHMDRATKDVVVQEFIYTGRWPVSYRVTTLFGHVLFAARTEADHSRRPLESRDRFDGGGISIVSNAVGASYELTDDEEVIELGERAHAAFPDIPLLGFDIVRDHDSGALYVLEANTDGWTWHFKSTTGLAVQKAWDFSYDSQFQGIRKTAYILIDRTRTLAR
jgi:hypothetical protein